MFAMSLRTILLIVLILQVCFR